jgi:hypothetical protein
MRAQRAMSVATAGLAAMAVALFATSSSASAAAAHGQRLHILLLHGLPSLRGLHGLHRLHRLDGLSLHANKSSNWFGYNQGALEQGVKLFTSVGGDWTVPTATQRNPGQAENSADWVGIGGGCVDAGCTLTDATLIQTGTEQDVSSSGQATYSAWWEILPAPAVTVSMQVSPGDHMHADIREALPGVPLLWTITLQDVTRSETFSITLPYVSTMLSAEWIEEGPLILGLGAGFATLPNLTSPNFDLATANGAPANLQPSEAVQLIDSSGAVISTPSSPDSDHDGFAACTWATSCAPPPSS